MTTTWLRIFIAFVLNLAPHFLMGLPAGMPVCGVNQSIAVEKLDPGAVILGYEATTQAYPAIHTLKVHL